MNKSKIQGGDRKVYILVKVNAVESGKNFLEAARHHTAEGGTNLAKTLLSFGFNYEK